MDVFVPPSPPLPPSSVSASDVPGQLGGGHDPHRGRLHLAQEEDVAGDGDPGSLPALHGVHPEGLPLLPQTHPPGAFREGHRRRLPLRPPRWTSMFSLMLLFLFSPIHYLDAVALILVF